MSERLYPLIFGRATIIQARMTSTRLPGKPLLPVLGRPLLAWQIERLKPVAPVIVATTRNPADDAIERTALEAGALVLRGPEDDVVGRFGMVASRWPFRTFAFLGADQPLADPFVLERLYAEFTPPYTRTVGQPYGLHLWAVSRGAIFEADDLAPSGEEREHTGAFWDRRPARYPCHVVSEEPDESHHRLTVDHPADFALHRKLIETAGPFATTREYVSLLHANPEWEQETSQIAAWKWSGFEDALRQPV